MLDVEDESEGDLRKSPLDAAHRKRIHITKIAKQAKIAGGRGQAATALPLPDRQDNLIRSVLDLVPIDSVLHAISEHVRRANDAEKMMSALTLRGERAKPLIETRSGPAWSTEEAAQRLRKSAETVRNHITANKLVGYRAINDGTRFLLPVWQFHHQDRHTTVRPWVAELLRAFGANGWALLDFLTAARSQLGGVHHLSLLLGGETDEVLAAARRANAD